MITNIALRGQNPFQACFFIICLAFHLRITVLENKSLFRLVFGIFGTSKTYAITGSFLCLMRLSDLEGALKVQTLDEFFIMLEWSNSWENCNFCCFKSKIDATKFQQEIRPASMITEVFLGTILYLKFKSPAATNCSCSFNFTDKMIFLLIFERSNSTENSAIDFSERISSGNKSSLTAISARSQLLVCSVSNILVSKLNYVLIFCQIVLQEIEAIS